MRITEEKKLCRKEKMLSKAIKAEFFFSTKGRAKKKL